MVKRATVRDVFKEPDIGDMIKVFGDTLRVRRVRHYEGRHVVDVVVNGQVNRTRSISMASWREYRDEAEVLTNMDVVGAFDSMG